jgi:hypothetical protein
VKKGKDWLDNPVGRYLLDTAEDEIGALIWGYIVRCRPLHWRVCQLTGLPDRKVREIFWEGTGWSIWRLSRALGRATLEGADPRNPEEP